MNATQFHFNTPFFFVSQLSRIIKVHSLQIPWKYICYQIFLQYILWKSNSQYMFPSDVTHTLLTNNIMMSLVKNKNALLISSEHAELNIWLFDWSL